CDALDFVALKRSLRCSWWHSLVGLLGLYHELRTKQVGLPSLAAAFPRGGACAADVLLSLADSSPLLSLDLTPSSLTSMPSPIDLRVFEEHSPARGGGRLRELLLSFLPSRLLLLKLLRATLAGEHVAVKEASALLLAHLGEEGTGESEEEELALPLLSCVAQRWAQKLPGRKKAKKKKPAEEADAGGGGERRAC
ncbi:MAG: hypothetical protein SGPRY_005555, partial [Prymnesium sp.]